MKNLLEVGLGCSLNGIRLSEECWKNLSSETSSVIDSLYPLEARVLTLRYNLNNDKGELEKKYNVVRPRGNLSFRLIGEEMGEWTLSVERARQIHADALRKLRHPARSKRLRAALGLEDKISFEKFLSITGEFYPPPPPSQAQEDYLSKSMAEFELSVRTVNVLERANILTVRDLASRTEKQILQYRNAGRKSLNELKDILREMGLGFGMTLEE